MSKIIPTIELENGKTYEIKRNRHILVQIDNMRHDSKISDTENQNYTLLQEKYLRLEKLAKRVQELEDEYYKDFDDRAGALYEKARIQYEKVLRETTEFEISTDGVVNKIRRELINSVEQLIINALTINDKGETIRSNAEANEIWCTYVDQIGHQAAQEWLLYAFNYLSGNDGDNDSNPFVMAQKDKALQKTKLKQGIAKVK